MPSPVGHVLAGLAVAYAVDRRGDATPRLVLTCALIAAAPDLDLLVPGEHRTFTHSLLAVGLVLLATWATTRVGSGRADWRVAIACALAIASHLLTDYVSEDPGTPSGLQLLWPGRQWFKSEWALFLATERFAPFSPFAMAMNARALLRELLVLGPVALLAWMLRRRRQTRALAIPDRREAST
jgi:membrane-bound metal-dependent hydrolase YbcI (DUF457 family)